MWFTALPPAPPTPITLMIGPLTSLSTISNIVVVSLPVVALQKPLVTLQELLKIALKPLPHPSEHGLERPALTRKLSMLHLRCALEEKADGGGVARRTHHVGEPALIARQPKAYRHVEDLLTQRHHAVHGGGAAGQHHAARQQL